MKRLSVAALSAALAFSAVPAWAQQIPGPANGDGPMYGYGHMWGWNGGWGWHAGTVLFPFVMLLALVGTVALILWLVRWTNQGAYHPHGCPYSRHPWPQPGRGALDILEERLARGEIGKEEFEEKRKLIGR